MLDVVVIILAHAGVMRTELNETTYAKRLA